MSNQATATKNDAKRAARTDVLLLDPREELCLFGGLDALDEHERGPLDTHDDRSSPYHDPRLRLPLEDVKVRNVNLLGVLETVLVAKVAGAYVVIDGRQRVRWARAANVLRATQGVPLLRVKCDPVRLAATDKSYALAVMIATNEQRTDDDIASKIEKLKRLMSSGVDIEQAAEYFGTSAAVVRSWLAFDDNAIDEVKRAVDAGRLAMSAGMSLARLKTPAQQQQALDKLTNGDSKSKISTRHARAAAKLVEKPDAHMGVQDKRTQRKLLALVESKDHKHAGKDVLAWWAGVEAALALIVGGDDKPDERLLALLGQARVTLEDK